MPCDYSKYPENWFTEIRPAVLERAGHKCEWCDAENYKAHPVTGSKVVLTVAHIDHDIENNGWENLAALCQKCHNGHDAPMRKKRRAHAGRHYPRRTDMEGVSYDYSHQ